VLIADDSFAGHSDTQSVEPLGKKKRIGVDPVRRE
jgi:hypothetical protein